MRQISLSGVETAVLKALGFVGSKKNGEDLRELLGNVEVDQLIDTLHGLAMVGYVDASATNYTNPENFDGTDFCVNTAYSRELRDVVSGGGKNRDDRRGRRRRRR